MKLDVENGKITEDSNVRLVMAIHDKDQAKTLVIVEILDMEHYCGYISTNLSEDEVYEKYPELPVEITYEGKLFDNIKNNFIGWDYAHSYNNSYTEREIVKECLKVFDMFNNKEK